MNDQTLHRDVVAAPALGVNLKSWALRHRGSLLFVALPTLLAALYYFLVAADLYASEARFVVRSPSRVQVGGLAGLLQTPGMARLQDDAYSVQDFMLSRDAVAALRKQVDLRGIFSRPEADFLARYPNLIDHDNTEDFYRYYQRRVAVVFDTTTGICTLTVKAFRPDDAQAVAMKLIDEAENLVNRMNERARQNAVRDAEDQVRLAEKSVSDARQATLQYRDREAMLDPGKSSGAMFDLLAKMQADLSASRTRLAELDRDSPGSPLRAELQSHIQAVEQQAENERVRLAGGSSSMAPKISEYDQLMLRQEFAVKELTTALGSLESARAEARRQQLYLDRVVEASLPDKALYPKRAISVLIVFISCFLAYSIGWLLVAGVREHVQD